MKKITILALHLEIGGVEKATIILANLLSENYKVELIVNYDTKTPHILKLNENIKLKILMPNLISNKKEFLNYLKQLKLFYAFKEGLKAIHILLLKKRTMIKAIKNCDSDIIISTRMSISFLLSKYGKKTQLKIAQEHNDHKFNKKYLKKVIKYSKNINYLMPSSKYLTKEYTKLLKLNKIICKYIPIPLENISNKRSNLKNNMLISVGRLSKEKGFLDMIDVFEKIKEKNKNLKLNIIGNGIEYEKILKKIKDKKLEKDIKLLGFKTQKELEKIYLNSDLYIMTSYEESFGISLLEAASFGIPAVAFDTARGAIEIIQNNKTGYLIKNRNINEMANKILEMYSNNKLNLFGTNAKLIAKEYSKLKIKNMWIDFLEKIGE